MSRDFKGIKRLVVLMLENRSFDHLLGSLKSLDPSVEGALAGSFSNVPNPGATSQQAPVSVGPATAYTMPFDPPHEFMEVKEQLYGSQPPNPLPTIAPLNGFLASALAAAQAAGVAAEAGRVLEYYEPSQLSVISSLAREFALFNFWYSGLPGPTWPNRFFVHAATSGGLVDSPNTDQIVLGFSFANGTVFHALSNAGKDWRVYHDGMPQTAGIDSLRLAYIDPFTRHFREMKYFVQDVNAGILPDYTFIEPQYDTGNNYLNGNSMHPLNDVRKGEQLVKQVYEALRNNPAYWKDTMLVITFDEHGGFFDHISPPAAVPTGDDQKYANPAHPFGFDRYGIRVPAIVVSAYTSRGTVIGDDPSDRSTLFDHSSVIATARELLGLQALTARDKQANTLDVALNLDAPRDDAPSTLPDPVKDQI